MKPKFSIIIPVYNVAPYLKECLDSVLNQTFDDWECVVVNDGSTDESGAILDAYAAKDRRFRFFHQENRGVGTTRNFALEQVKGEWTLFLDGDDLLHPRTLELLQKTGSRYPRECLFSFGFREVTEAPVWESLPEAESSVRELSTDIPFEMFYSYCWQYCYSRKLLEGFEFPNYTLGEDRVFVSDILLNRTAACRRLPYVFYAYRKRAASAVHAEPSAQRLRDELLHRQAIVSLVTDSGKRVPLGNTFWFAGFFLKQFPAAVKRLPREQQKDLWILWQEVVSVFRDSRIPGFFERTLYTLLLRLFR